ncbi:hypothetical protein Lalb_Chr11g0064781 [Lupinus albus]|uniref:Uncharacterized protein n=1 Tax=Lupinus albus TaxID=3870 RepID=A0A6A4PQB1_LUPAL|nr:hypothetical protein Lalb_Chr11g0064781 [Lupinus albus]
MQNPNLLNFSINFPIFLLCNYNSSISVSAVSGFLESVESSGLTHYHLHQCLS